MLTKKEIFLIGEKKSEIIGMVRYEINKIFAYVSINISRNYRNLGYGFYFLKMSEKFLKKNLVLISNIKKK